MNPVQVQSDTFCHCARAANKISLNAALILRSLKMHGKHATIRARPEPAGLVCAQKRCVSVRGVNNRANRL